MRFCVYLLLLAPIACGHWSPRRAGPVPESEMEAEPAPASQPSTRPAISDRAGMDALRGWAHECYQLGLRHDPVFGKGGQLVVRWRADRAGDLLFMDFSVDTFRGWAINSSGETLAECVVRRAREARVRWSVEGTAPLRLAPGE